MEKINSITFIRIDVLENFRFWHKYSMNHTMAQVGEEVIAQANALMYEDGSNERASNLLAEARAFSEKKKDSRSSWRTEEGNECWSCNASSTTNTKTQTQLRKHTQLRTSCTTSHKRIISRMVSLGNITRLTNLEDGNIEMANLYLIGKAH